MTAFPDSLARALRRNPEEQLQRNIVWLLTAKAASNVWWEGVNSGGFKLGRSAAGRQKAMGIRKGSPDLHFVLPDGRAAYMELKAPKGRLSVEQDAFMDWCVRNGVPHAVCSSMDQALSVLTEWGVLSGVTW